MHWIVRLHRGRRRNGRMHSRCAPHREPVGAGAADRGGAAGTGRQISTPSAYPKLLESNLNWGDATEPQENLNGRRLAWPRGEVLGGSGALSASIHVRGCRADYDAWRDLGNPGWGFEDLAPLWTDPPAGGDAPAVNQLTEVFLRACGECGIRRYDQFDGPAEEGAGFYPVARVRGERWTPPARS